MGLYGTSLIIILHLKWSDCFILFSHTVLINNNQVIALHLPIHVAGYGMQESQVIVSVN